LSYGYNPYSGLSRHLDKVEVAFEIIVSGYQVPGFPNDHGFENFIVIGIAADL
jgi:hypothetical protein